MQSQARGIIFSSPEYRDVLARCKKIANEDYKVAKESLTQACKVFESLNKNLSETFKQQLSEDRKGGEATNARKVATQIAETQDTLDKVNNEARVMEASLSAKKRALEYFTIAFMGKTKAGKSTLHAILTGEGWNEIGEGKQRTTRCNRNYEWNNIRIIDTPGIGAPDGKSDEDIARSIIEEADLICYVVTNDSIQETEFDFLRLLKEQNKPLVILLNVHNNLCNKLRLQRFLKNPHKLFAGEGKSGLNGHIKRIRTYAEKHYANDYFYIIPVMLLAARLAKDTEYRQRELKNQFEASQIDRLWQASQIENFLDFVRDSITENATIRRSQTMLGSTACTIEEPAEWLRKQVQDYKALIDQLEKKKNKVQRQIQKIARQRCDSLLSSIKGLFQKALNEVPSFAERHWKSDQLSMESDWRRIMERLEVDKALKNLPNSELEKFNQDVEEVINELGTELSLLDQLQEQKYGFITQNTGIWKNIAVDIFIGILSLGSTILRVFNPLLGTVTLAASFGFSFIGEFLKSKEERRQEAVQGILNSLEQQVKENRDRTLKEVESKFNDSCDRVEKDIVNYLEKLINNLDKIAKNIELSEQNLKRASDSLNYAYAKRIIDWASETYQPLKSRGINNEVVSEVKRDFQASTIKIRTKFSIPIRKPPEKIKQVIQQDVYIEN